VYLWQKEEDKVRWCCRRQ